MIKTPLSTVLGGAFWTPGATVIGGHTPALDQYVSKLFANNEQGFFYDPNDLSTMYQDAVGTVPVTGAGQPVGLMLDKSKNLFKQKLTVSEPSSWVKSSLATVEGNKITLRGAGGVVLPHNTPSGQLLHARIKYTKTPEVVLTFIDSGIVAGGSIITTTTESSGEISALFYPKTTSTYIRLASEGEFTLDSITLEVVEGNHAYRTASASRPILRKNAVTGANYLEFDGTDDFLETSNIDFSGTDKVSLFAGVRKLSDGALAMVFELSEIATNSNGAFYIVAPNGVAQPNFSFGSRGTSLSAIPSTNDFAAPYSAVLTAYANIAAPITSLKVNNTVARTATITQGTGNYGNYPLYIGRRAGTSLPFNGHIYGLIGVGKLTTEDETVGIEKELAKRTGVTLNV